MADWNEQAAPNNNLPAKTIRSSDSITNKQNTTKSLKKSSDNRK
jgi:hypothetical protein